MIAFVRRLLRLGHRHDVQGAIRRFDAQRDEALAAARRTKAGGIEGAFFPRSPRQEDRRAR